MGHKVGLSERAQNACGQESRGDVGRRLLHRRTKHIHDSGGGRRERSRGVVSVRQRGGPARVVRASLRRLCVVPVDVVAHAGDEPGQEHERLPVWRLFTRHTAHIAVGPAVALTHTHTGSRFVIIVVIIIIIIYHCSNTARREGVRVFP